MVPPVEPVVKVIVAADASGFPALSFTPVPAVTMYVAEEVRFEAELSRRSEVDVAPVAPLDTIWNA